MPGKSPFLQLPHKKKNTAPSRRCGLFPQKTKFFHIFEKKTFALWDIPYYIFEKAIQNTCFDTI